MNNSKAAWNKPNKGSTERNMFRLWQKLAYPEPSEFAAHFNKIFEEKKAAKAARKEARRAELERLKALSERSVVAEYEAE